MLGEKVAKQKTCLKSKDAGGAGVATFVRCLTLDYGSGHDLAVREFEPASGFAVRVEPAWDSLSPSLFPPLPALSRGYMHSLSPSK